MLVGHSYGGAVVTVAGQHEKVAALYPEQTPLRTTCGVVGAHRIREWDEILQA